MLLSQQHTVCTALDPIRVPLAACCRAGLYRSTPPWGTVSAAKSTVLSAFLEWGHLQTRIGQGLPNPEKENGGI